MTTLVLASTLYGAATAVAALDMGMAQSSDGPRVLVVANNAPAAEVVPSVHEVAGFAAIQDAFDHVVSLNRFIEPFNPSSWQQGRVNSPIWERVLRSEWHLGDGPLHLVLESIQVRPAQTLLEIFADASVSVYADGLMSYGPTRRRISLGDGSRIEELWYPDLVPGLSPLLLSEHGVRRRPIPVNAVRARLVSIPHDNEATIERVRGSSVLVVAQYLSSLGLMTQAEESGLYRDMVREAARLGADTVVFKPHPGDISLSTSELEAAATSVGVELVVIESRAPVESVVPDLAPTHVVGCFSTALITCHAMFGVEPVSVGARTMLTRLRPYPNSNRVPLVIVDQLAAVDAERANDVDELSQKLRAVAYMMQPWLLPELAESTRSLLESGGLPEAYLDTERLTELDLPGADPVRGLARRTARHPILRRPARWVYRGLGATSLTRRVRRSLSADDSQP